MQDHSSFNASYDMDLNLENRFCRLAAHCAPPPLQTLATGSKVIEYEFFPSNQAQQAPDSFPIVP